MTFFQNFCYLHYCYLQCGTLTNSVQHHCMIATLHCQCPLSRYTTPKAHTHLVYHLSELVDDGSYQIQTRQHIKTVVSPRPPPLLSLPLPLCLSVHLSPPAPRGLASIICTIYSIFPTSDEHGHQQKT